MGLDKNTVFNIMIPMNPSKVIPEFDSYLEARRLRFEATLVGSSALILKGYISRETHDVDVLKPEIPADIKKAAEDFAEARPELKLSKDWFNGGPPDLPELLPRDWELKVQPAYEGKALSLKSLGRMDLVRTKLKAFCDRYPTDDQDMKGLKPTAKELDESAKWVKTLDKSEDWQRFVEDQVQLLKLELGLPLEQVKQRGRSR